MMAQSFARFGRITTIPSVATNRLTFPAPATAETWVFRCRLGSIASGDGRTGSGALTPGGSPVAGRPRRRWALNASPTSAGSGIAPSRDALPRNTNRPARQSRSSNCSRAASIDGGAQACDQHEDRVVADTRGSLMSQLSSSRCTSFAVIAFRDTGVVTLGGVTCLARVPSTLL